MAILINKQPITLASGSIEIGPVNIPNGIHQLKLSLDRCTTVTPTVWPNPLTEISVNVFVATGGGPDKFLAGFTAVGGILTNQTGTEAAPVLTEAQMTELEINIPLAAGRKLKAAISVVNGPFVSVLNASVT